MEARGIVKAFPKRKKVRDDSGKSIPPKIPKEEGTEIPEGKSYVPMTWNILLLPQLVNWGCCCPKGFFWPQSVFSVEVMARLL